MKRDAQATRQRILEAAIAEFAQYGIAGARVDRIAEAAGSNKAMIYAYYTSKDRLFDAVFDAIVVRNTLDVPMDAYDLPEYVARLFDQYQAHPELLRLGLWDQLERGGQGMKIKSVVECNENKVSEIARAQREGVVGTRFTAPLLLEMILSLTLTRPVVVDGHEGEDERGRRRQAIKDAVKDLVSR